MLIFKMNMSALDEGVPSHQAIVSLLSYSAAVDRRVLPRAHLMVPFTTNSACMVRGVTDGVPAPLCDLSTLLLQNSIAKCQSMAITSKPAFYSILFGFVVVVERGASFKDKQWQYR